MSQALPTPGVSGSVAGLAAAATVVTDVVDLDREDFPEEEGLRSPARDGRVDERDLSL